MGELLGALGLAWPRLLLYPGGIFALVAAWLLAAWLRRCACAPILQPEATWQPKRLIVAVAPLAVLSLLPLAPARPFPYGLDLFVALALLEWPRVWLRSNPTERLAHTQEPSALAHPQPPTRSALLSAYWPLLFAAWGWAEAAGGLGLSHLLAWPEPLARQMLMLTSTALWLTGLPLLLHNEPHGLVGRLRALGLTLIACLPLVALLAAYGAAWLPNAWAGWLFPLAALVSAALLLGALLRLSPKLLQRGQILLALGLLGAWGSLYLA